MPVTILGIWTINETGKLVDENDRLRYHKLASLLLNQQDGTFRQEDIFNFAGLTWKFQGSSSTNLDGTQIVEVISKETFEIGDFRRDN